MKIESGVPLPEPRTDTIAHAIRELMKAKLGDSVYVEKKPWSVRWTANRIGGAGWCKVRKEGEAGSRAWKVAEPVKEVEHG